MIKDAYNALMNPERVLNRLKVIESSLQAHVHATRFEIVGPQLAKNGWCVIPQTQGRKPGIAADYKMISWMDYASKAPSLDVLQSWATLNRTLNTACIMGKPSQNIFALDIDITDEPMVKTVLSIVHKMLPVSPFRRVGNAPKIALFYRSPSDEDGCNVIRNASYRFETIDSDGALVPSSHMIEIQSNNKLMTMLGVHHQTGYPFTWDGVNIPTIHRPETAPLVTAEELEACLAAIAHVFPFVQKKSLSTNEHIQWDNNGSIIQESIQNGEGLLKDGREEHLSHLSWAVFTRFASQPDFSRLSSKEMLEHIGQSFQQSCEMSGRWNIRYLQTRIQNHISRLFAKYDAGDIKIDQKTQGASFPKTQEQQDALERRLKEEQEKLKKREQLRRELIEELRKPTLSGTPISYNEQTLDTYDLNILEMLDIYVARQGALLTPEVLHNFVAQWNKGYYPSWYIESLVALRETREHEAENDSLHFDEDDDVKDSVFHDFLKSRPHLPGATQRHQVNADFSENVEDNSALQIPEDRTALKTTIQTGLQAGFDIFFSDVYGHPTDVCLETSQQRVVVLKAPTGAGKTSQCIHRIATDPRTYAPAPVRNAKTGAIELKMTPGIMALPTYNNLAELRERATILNLPKNASDAVFRQQAHDMGLLHVRDVEARIQALQAQAEGTNLKCVTYSGKVRGGCLLPERMTMATEAGLGTSGLCKAMVMNKSTNSFEEELCPHYTQCPAIAQRQALKDANLVFLPHPFASLSIPEELKEARYVVIDERVHHLFLHVFRLKTNILLEPRPNPRICRDDYKTLGLVYGKDKLDYDEVFHDLHSKREAAVDIVLDAFKKNACPANALRHTEGGMEMLKACLRICKDAMSRADGFRPSLTDDEIRERCKKPKAVSIREEWHFWDVISDRIQRLNREEVIKDALENLENDVRDLDVRHREEFADAMTKAQETHADLWMDSALIKETKHRHHEEKRKLLETLKSMKDRLGTEASGDKDARLQLLKHGVATRPNEKISDKGMAKTTIRISYRTTPNWQGIPTLLLDASAAPKIIKKIWDCDVVEHNVVHDLGKSLNVRTVWVPDTTFSNYQFLRHQDTPIHEMHSPAQLVSKTRQFLSMLALAHGHSRVVVGSSASTREVLNTGWVAPKNMDFCHYGAMRGLDMFKGHDAAVSIGRLELPVDMIDGLSGALTYDDEKPEAAQDIFGTGHNEKGEPLRPNMSKQKLRLRSGHHAYVKAPCCTQTWSRMIQTQYREEELLQLLGRLRPVYRNGEPPVWYAVSSVMPQSIIIDDVVSMDDMMQRVNPVLECMNRSYGVVSWQSIATQNGDIIGSTFHREKMFDVLGLPRSQTTAEEFLALVPDIMDTQNPKNRVKYAFLRRMACYQWSYKNEDISSLRLRSENPNFAHGSLVYTHAQTHPQDAVLSIKSMLSDAGVPSYAIDVSCVWRPDDCPDLPSRPDDNLDIILGTRKQRLATLHQHKSEIGRELSQLGCTRMHTEKAGVFFNMTHGAIHESLHLYALKSVLSSWIRKGRSITDEEMFAFGVDEANRHVEEKALRKHEDDKKDSIRRAEAYQRRVEIYNPALSQRETESDRKLRVFEAVTRYARYHGYPMPALQDLDYNNSLVHASMPSTERAREIARLRQQYKDVLAFSKKPTEHDKEYWNLVDGQEMSDDDDIHFPVRADDFSLLTPLNDYGKYAPPPPKEEVAHDLAISEHARRTEKKAPVEEAKPVVQKISTHDTQQELSKLPKLSLENYRAAVAKRQKELQEAAQSATK